MENQETATAGKRLLVFFANMDWRTEINELLTGTKHIFTYVETHTAMLELVTLNKYDVLFTAFSNDRLKNENYLKDVASCDRELKTIFVSEHILEKSQEGLSVYRPTYFERPLNRTDLMSTLETIGPS